MYPRIPWEQVAGLCGPVEHAFGTTELGECSLFPHIMFL